MLYCVLPQDVPGTCQDLNLLKLIYSMCRCNIWVGKAGLDLNAALLTQRVVKQARVDNQKTLSKGAKQEIIQ